MWRQEGSFCTRALLNSITHKYEFKSTGEHIPCFIESNYQNINLKQIKIPQLGKLLFLYALVSERMIRAYQSLNLYVAQSEFSPRGGFRAFEKKAGRIQRNSK